MPRIADDFARALREKLLNSAPPETELEACELFEAARWGDEPTCVSCSSVDVYKIKKRGSKKRNVRLLWRCRACGHIYSVRSKAFSDRTTIKYKKLWWVLGRALEVPPQELPEVLRQEIPDR